MINIKTFVFNPFLVNSFVLYDETQECVIIDASCYENEEFDSLFDFIASHSLRPVAVLNTHGHVDHLTGTRQICEKYFIKFCMNSADRFLLENAVDYGISFGFHIEDPPEPGSWLNDGDLFKFGNSEIKIWNAPGHSPGSLIFYISEAKLLITGDVLFAGSIGRTNLPGGDYAQLINSIKTKILTLPGDTRVIPGHGAETNIAFEMKNNPFLKGSF